MFGLHTLSTLLGPNAQTMIEKQVTFKEYDLDKCTSKPNPKIVLCSGGELYSARVLNLFKYVAQLINK